MDRVELYNGGFPVTTETFDFVQDAYQHAISALTAMGGDTFILKGVQVVADTVSDGAIVYHGEYLPFLGGQFDDTVSIYEDVQEVVYNEDGDNDGNLDQKRAYVKRYAQCGAGGLESFNFGLLKRLTPLTQHSTPVGGIIMWSGAINALPHGWVLCNGANGTPDLRDRFVVGAGDVYVVGEKGGKNEIALIEAEMPAHNHNGTTANAGNHKHTGSTYAAGSHSHLYKDSYYIEHRTPKQDSFSGYGSEYIGTGFDGSGDVDGDNRYIWYKNRNTNSGGSHSHSLNMNNAGNHTHNFITNTKGGGQAHENRPPYLALAYIMFKGL